MVLKYICTTANKKTGFAVRVVRKLRNIGCITTLLFCFNAIAFAESVATVVEVEGLVETRVSNQQWLPATVNDSLSGGDEIQTYEGKSSLILSDESMLKLNRNTYMQMQSVSQAAAWQNQQGLFNAASPTLKSIYRLFKGEAWLRNNNREVDIDIETPTVTASLRGTELHIEIVSPALVNITVLEGAVLASNAAGSIQAVAGELIIAPLGQAPRKQTLLTPQDSVQWTVRVPNLIQQQDWMAATAGNVQLQDVAAIMQDLSLQNIQAAQNKLTQLESQSDQPLGSLAALVALSAGEHEQARQAFARVSETSDNDVVALRGLALSSLLTNKKTQAIAAAEKAVNASAGGTATDWILLSYMQRADFDLVSAERSASKALELDSKNILALNSLALLQFADDRISEARDTIEAALAIDEADSLSHSLLGFLRLSERDQIGAKQSFTTALVHDPANSEAHLGLSLWAQREGNAEQAQKSLATAIALDPQRSLYLSYWAKVLHQEQRFDKALTVLKTAARLDSQDPTPHYYRAIIERDLFRAGEAITSLETAIELNDKRAVYRSRLLLDQDIAARNINLATIYDGLGMDLLATQKAVQSTLDDYRNFSAHLFLSSALTQEGRTFPADSAVLVSGLLFPANANALSTINDYTVFFEQPELDSNVTLSVGSNGLIDAAAFLGGVAPQQNMSYALGASAQNVDSFNGLNETDRQQLSGTIK